MSSLEITFSPRRPRGGRSRIAEQAYRGPGCRAKTVRARCDRIQDRRRGRRHRGASPSMRRGFAGNEIPLSRRAVPKRILAMTAPRLVMARAPAPARDAPPRHPRPGSSATAPTFDRSPRRSGTTRDDTHDLRCNVVPRGTVRRRRPAGCANQRFRLRRRDRLRGPWHASPRSYSRSALICSQRSRSSPRPDD